MARQSIDRYIYRSDLPRRLSLDAVGVGIRLPGASASLENRTKITGVLHTVDRPSVKAPHGSDGRQVLIPKAVAEQALPSLVGAPINTSTDLQDHDRTRTCGVVTRAFIEDDNVHIEGILFKRNWPQTVAAIQRNKGQLGLSYEITGVKIRSEDEPVWTLDEYTYTGCSILDKNAAAYGHATSIAARAALPDCWTPVMRALQVQGRKLAGLER
jgi:hypothetical protein